jgi:uncharacterized protein YbcI
MKTTSKRTREAPNNSHLEKTKTYLIMKILKKMTTIIMKVITRKKLRAMINLKTNSNNNRNPKILALRNNLRKRRVQRKKR